MDREPMNTGRVAAGFAAAALAPGAALGVLILVGVMVGGTPPERAFHVAWAIFSVVSRVAAGATLCLAVPAYLVLRRRIIWDRLRSGVIAGALVGAAAGAGYMALGATSWGWTANTPWSMAYFASVMAPFGALGGLVFWFVAAYQPRPRAAAPA